MEDLESNYLQQSLLLKEDKNYKSITTMAESIESINQASPSSPVKEDDLLENPELEKQLSIDEPHIYDLPDVEAVTKRVMFKLLSVSVVCTVLMVAEIVGGIMAGSLAIMTDAAHLFSDLSGFFISIFSLWLTKQPSTKKLTYGYHRAEVIGALTSIVLIWGLTICLITEAVERVINQNFEINRYFMLGTAIFGLLCNLLMGKILHGTGGHHHGHDHGHGHIDEHSHDEDHDHAKQHDHKNEKEHKNKKEMKDKKKTMDSSGNII